MLDESLTLVSLISLYRYLIDLTSVEYYWTYLRYDGNHDNSIKIINTFGKFDLYFQTFRPRRVIVSDI